MRASVWIRALGLPLPQFFAQLCRSGVVGLLKEADERLVIADPVLFHQVAYAVAGQRKIVIKVKHPDSVYIFAQRLSGIFFEKSAEIFGADMHKARGFLQGNIPSVVVLYVANRLLDPFQIPVILFLPLSGDFFRVIPVQDIEKTVGYRGKVKLIAVFFFRVNLQELQKAFAQLFLCGISGDEWKIRLEMEQGALVCGFVQIITGNLKKEISDFPKASGGVELSRIYDQHVISFQRIFLFTDKSGQVAVQDQDNLQMTVPVKRAVAVDGADGFEVQLQAGIVRNDLVFIMVHGRPSFFPPWDQYGGIGQKKDVLQKYYK